jgi:mannose-6-phosphate isomerase-like protein (cupin superfamily)
MLVISETEERTIRTPTAVMAGLAGPSQGSTQLSTWRVRMAADHQSPVHTIDRDQVWMPVAGTFTFVVDDESSQVSAGQAVVVPAGVVRRFHTGGGPAEALVAMQADGQASTPDSDEPRPVPWAR